MWEKDAFGKRSLQTSFGENMTDMTVKKDGAIAAYQVDVKRKVKCPIYNSRFYGI